LVTFVLTVLVLQTTAYVLWLTRDLRRLSRMSMIEKGTVVPSNRDHSRITFLLGSRINGSTFKPPPQLQLKLDGNSSGKLSVMGTNSSADKEIKLWDVLEDWDGFQLFMQHLTYEFSMSNLLGIVELTQFQQYYRVERMDADKERTEYDDDFVKLPLERIPHSTIIYDKNLTIQQKCVSLCEKYILPGAIHELNLSSKTIRVFEEDYHSTFSLKSVAQCVFLFDIVIEETSNSILDSFWRFRKTNSFLEWANKN